MKLGQNIATIFFRLPVNSADSSILRGNLPIYYLLPCIVRPILRHRKQTVPSSLKIFLHLERVWQPKFIKPLAKLQFFLCLFHIFTHIKEDHTLQQHMQPKIMLHNKGDIDSYQGEREREP